MSRPPLSPINRLYCMLQHILDIFLASSMSLYPSSSFYVTKLVYKTDLMHSLTFDNHLMYSLTFDSRII